MIKPGERPSGVTKEQIDRKIREVADQVERRRLQTIANIMDPFIRHKEALGLSDEQLAEKRQEAIELGRLEAARLQETLNKGMVHRLDTLFGDVAAEHPKYLTSLRKASGSVRSEIKVIRARAVKETAHYDDYDTPEDYIRQGFRRKTFPLLLTARVGGDVLLTTTILQRLGILGEGQSIVNLRRKNGWQGEPYNQTGSIADLPTSVSEDIVVDIYQRNGQDQEDSWDIYLKIGGATGLEMMTTPVQENPFLE